MGVLRKTQAYGILYVWLKPANGAAGPYLIFFRVDFLVVSDNRAHTLEGFD